MKRFASVVGAIALAVASVPAAAMDYSWRPYRNQIVIDASGEMVADEAKHFIAWIEQSSRQWNGRKATAIVFNSPGGIVKGGVDMGLVVADFHMITGVAPGGERASACVIAWAAGALKSAASDSKIGVHMMSAMGGDPAIDATFFNIKWLQKTGAPNSVMVGAMSTKPDDVYWLTQDELTAWGVKIVPRSPVVSQPLSSSQWSFLQNTVSEVNFGAPGGGEPGWVRQGRSCSRRRG